MHVAHSFLPLHWSGSSANFKVIDSCAVEKAINLLTRVALFFSIISYFTVEFTISGVFSVRGIT